MRKKLGRTTQSTVFSLLVMLFLLLLLPLVVFMLLLVLPPLSLLCDAKT